MIYVTGDTHGRLDLLKKRLKLIRRNDVLLVAGDFGFIWDGDKKENKILIKLAKRPILFIDGKNENYALLNRYPIVDFCGGKAHHITGRMYHLLRGECYNFGGVKIFTFGGAETDADFINSNEEAAIAVQPNHAQMKRGIEAASICNGDIDYFVTHEAPATIRATITDSRGGATNEYLGRLMEMCKYSGWYFGCYHVDRSFATVYHAVYNRVLPLTKTANFIIEKPNKQKRTKKVKRDA